MAVIHQPRYDTLQLFDDLILCPAQTCCSKPLKPRLAVGGSVVYAGPTEAAVDHFRNKLQVLPACLLMEKTGS